MDNPNLPSEQNERAERKFAAPTAHTPGPWHNAHAVQVWAEDAKGRMTICDIRGWGHLTGKGHGALALPHGEAIKIQEANANLIAAAPDMLAALIELADIVQGLLDDTNLHGLGIDSFTLQPAQLAITKATGAT